MATARVAECIAFNYVRATCTFDESHHQMRQRFSFTIGCPLCDLPLAVSALRSSAPRCACTSTYSLPLSLAQIILSFVRKQGSRSSEQAKHICRDCDNEITDPHEQLCDDCKATDVCEELDRFTKPNEITET
jgi:hypothetical protein